MSIGVALAEARSEAGLSVTDVSERTRIRAAIIRDIERDDYATCGGDFYARGHIRAIAKVVGADPVPLIAEYDAARMPADGPDGQAADLPEAPGLVGADADRTQAGYPVSTRPSGTEPIRPVTQLSDDDLVTPAPSGAGLADSGQAAGARLSESAHAVAAWAAESAHSAVIWLVTQSDRIARSGHMGRSGHGGLDRPARVAKPRPRLTAALALALLAAIGLLIYLLVSGSTRSSSGTSPHSSAAALQHHGAGAARHGGRPAQSGQAGAGTRQPRAVLLTPAGIAAFGPGGAGHSDNPQTASLAIDGNRRTAWHTDWYTTPDFGGLQSGTGLLLDMGQPVTISSASILFGRAPGGAFQLRTGNSPALPSMQPVAQATDSGGSVTVRVSRPVQARYLLVWVTRLPPDTSGTYQAFIYDIAVRGVR